MKSIFWMTYLKSKEAPLLIIISGVVVLLAASLLALIDDTSDQLFLSLTFGSMAVTSALSIKLLRRKHAQDQE
ncbi:MAG: hypothetical protein ACRD38_11430, partial [Nitrososphaerales archaeon]